jgi:hypothetical protein
VRGMAVDPEVKGAPRGGSFSIPLAGKPSAPLPMASDEAIRAVVRENAARRKLDVRALRLCHVPGPAIAIEIEVSGPSEFRERRPEDASALFGALSDFDRPRIEGFYIAIRSEQGHLLHVAWYAQKLKLGGGWTDPRLTT